MNQLRILKEPHAESCATCSEWMLAQYCHVQDGIGGNEPYCTKLCVSLATHFKMHGSTRVTCGSWTREWIESDANTVYYSLIGAGR